MGMELAATPSRRLGQRLSTADQFGVGAAAIACLLSGLVWLGSARTVPNRETIAEVAPAFVHLAPESGKILYRYAGEPDETIARPGLLRPASLTMPLALDWGHEAPSPDRMSQAAAQPPSARSRAASAPAQRSTPQPLARVAALPSAPPLDIAPLSQKRPEQPDLWDSTVSIVSMPLDGAVNVGKAAVDNATTATRWTVSAINRLLPSW
ncbi:MAG: hypothetical protein DI537_08310 [Stutzerimonas stutzeri]|nr:MAG: hypothetical protein DI537_08310 [Stutzerimonas stutzeri]